MKSTLVLILLFFAYLASSQLPLRRVLYSPNYGLPSTGGYYVNTGNVVPTVTPNVAPGVLPSTGGYYINTGNVVPTNVVPTNVIPTNNVLPSTGGYYVNTGGVIPTVNPVIPTVNPGVLPSTGGYYINTGNNCPGGGVMPNNVQPVAPVSPGPVVSPYSFSYTMPGGAYGVHPMATQTGISEQASSATCDTSCASCSGPGSDQCLTCVEGRYPQRLEGKNTYVCLPHQPSP